MKKIIIILSFLTIVFSQTFTIPVPLKVKGDIGMTGRVAPTYYGTFYLPTITADRTWTLPNADLNFGSLMADLMSTRGDIIYRNPSNVTARLGLGANKFVLQSNGTDLSWSEFLASEMNIVDAGAKITATEVEGALQENRTAIDLNTPKVTMTYPSAGIALSTGSAWSASITNNSANWNTAYTDRLKWDGGVTGLTASTGRTSLGGTTIGQNIFIKTNPSAITFGRANVNNTFDWLSATNFRTAIGVDVAGTDNSTDVTLNANATAGGMSIAAQEISNRASTNAQTGYATAAQITAQEANTTHKTSDGSDHTFIDQSVIIGASPSFTSPLFTTDIEVRRDNILVAQSDAYGLLLSNTTAATALDSIQYSPPTIWQGYGWKTDATAASQKVEFRSYVKPIEGTSAPTGNWVLESSINDGAYSNLITVQSGGNVGIDTDNPQGIFDVNDRFSIRSGGTKGEGRQYLFMNPSVWSAANSGADIINANNFHYFDTGEVRVEFESDDLMAFYIESGTGKDSWYGLQEGSTHHWTFGQDATDDGNLKFYTGQGLEDGTEIFRLQKDGDVSVGGVVPSGKFEVADNSGSTFSIISTYSEIFGLQSILAFRKSSSDVLGTLSATEDSEDLGLINFDGVLTGGTLNTATYILAEQDGDTDATSLGGRLSFWTATKGSSPVERMVILGSGNVGMGFAVPLSKVSIDGGLHVGGASDAGDNNLLVDGTVITNSNYAMEGYSTGRNVIRSFRFQATGTASNTTCTFTTYVGATGFNSEALAAETVTEGTPGTRFSLDADGKILTITGLSQTVVGVGPASLSINGTESPVTVFVSYSGGNLVVQFFDFTVTNQVFSDLVTDKDIQIQILYFTSS